MDALILTSLCTLLLLLDMFQPTELICSIQGTFNTIKIVDRNDEQALKNVPDGLKADARYGEVPVRTYEYVQYSLPILVFLS